MKLNRYWRDVIAPTLLLLSMVGLTGCETTGDPNQDTIFFSSQKANANLAQMRARLNAIRWDTGHIESETNGLEQAYRNARASRDVSRERVAWLQAQVEELERRLHVKESQLNQLRSSNSDMAEEVRQVQSEIAVLSARIARLRAQLLLLIEYR